MRLRSRLFSILLSLIFSSCTLFAQSASTSTLTGDITDPSGAVVAGAEVILTDISTNASQKATSNQAGHYSFPSVQPGEYKLTVKKERFRQTTTTFTVSVGINVSQNIKLEVGGANEIVEVQATGQELQTADASVGNVLDRATLQSLPSLSRDATALLQLQPMAAPSYNAGPGTSGGEGNTTSGGVAGALNDQNTFNLDGGDATSNTEGDANYNSGMGTPQAVVPTPVESIEEFRVTTNNSNTFARSSGAQVQLVTRRGTNQWHGAGWEYNQNTDYNANFWQLNNAGEARPVWQDNRFGGRIGGPIFKDKAFFFLMYEGRRFKKGETFTRNVPSALLRQGILQFQDANVPGKIDQFNFAAGAPTAQCASGPCDPRGLGMDPIVSQIWNTYEPQGNNASEGDGLNFVGFDSTVPVISHENDGIARLDYNLTKNWTISGVGRYAVVDINGASQIDIGGLLPGDKLGVPKSTDLEPLQPRYYVLGLTGHIGSNITTDTHVDFLRHFWQWHRTAPFPQVSGLGAALQIYAESNVSGLVPMNIDTQNARSRIWNGKDYTLNEELSWLKGTHLLQFGGAFRHQHFYHVRDDKVVGGLAEPIYFSEWTSKHLDLSSYRPSTLVSGDEHNWDKAYAAVMGLIDHSAQLLTRASDLTPNPPGTPNTANSLVDDYDIHFVDTWRFKPNFTLAYGLDWGYQTPPYETRGQQTVMVDTTNNNQILPFSTWSRNMISSALQGKAYVPILGFMPVRQAGRKYPYDPDYHNFAPRLSLAWNPKGGANVFRLGYGRYFDRINGVGIVMTPALGIGFGNGVTCTSPNSPNVGLGPTVCGGSKTDPSNALRIGTDGGTVPIPPLESTTAPIIPGLTTATPYQSYDFRIDPKRKVGVEDTWTLNMQHRVNNGLMVELGYVGRVGRHLYSGADVNQIPYMFTLGGQQFQSAYDFLMQPAQQAIIQNANVCTGGTPATCPGITPQPFFEAALGPGGTANVAYNTAGFTGIGDATDTFDYLGVNTLPLDQQFLGADITTSNGNSFYNAGYASVREQMKNGLMFQVNYTWSHSMDDSGLAQEYVFFNPTDGFNLRRDYANSYFDRRHVVTGFFVYDLPFGGKGRFRTGNFLDKIIGGWQLSTALTASSGLPQKVYNYNSCAELGDGYLTQCAAWIPTGSAASAHFGVHHMPDGTINVYANPSAVSSAFRAPLFSDPRMGGTPIVGFGRWNVDSALTKTTKITERVSFGLTLQAVNVFNHMEFADPTPDLSNTTTFGQTSTQYNTPRFLSIGGRIDF